jgi:hypothetical protein
MRDPPGTAHKLLYDREGDGEFFQVYTHIFDERFFFEIVAGPRGAALDDTPRLGRDGVRQ